MNIIFIFHFLSLNRIEINKRIIGSWSDFGSICISLFQILGQFGSGFVFIQAQIVS
jgi:hypothetical protein